MDCVFVATFKEKGFSFRNFFLASMGGERGACRVLVEKPEGKNHWGDLGVDGRIILRWIFRKLVVGSMDWIELVQDRDRWRALVNAVMNLRVP